MEKQIQAKLTNKAHIKLAITKAKHGFKTKAQAIEYIIQHHKE